MTDKHISVSKLETVIEQMLKDADTMYDMDIANALIETYCPECLQAFADAHGGVDIFFGVVNFLNDAEWAEVLHSDHSK